MMILLRMHPQPHQQYKKNNPPLNPLNTTTLTTASSRKSWVNSKNIAAESKRALNRLKKAVRERVRVQVSVELNRREDSKKNPQNITKKPLRN